jgi:alkylation response protein AidB-like acyl-CoA dehydrogenase
VAKYSQGRVYPFYDVLILASQALCRVGAQAYEEGIPISCGRFFLTYYFLFCIFYLSLSKFLSLFVYSTHPEASSYHFLDGNKWVINGSKIFITNSTADISPVCVVQCVTDTLDSGKPEVSCILGENGTKGFIAETMHSKMCWRPSNTGQLTLQDCRVLRDNLLGKGGEGFHQVLKPLDGGRLSIGAMGLEGAQGAFELALDYSKKRKQFGRPIGSFQANAFKLASMATEIEMARLLLYKACWLADRNRATPKGSAMAKLVCSETYYRTGPQTTRCSCTADTVT